MRYTTIVLLLLISLLSSCGKSPLFNKLEKNFQEISGINSLSEYFIKEQLEFTINWKVAPSLDELGILELELARPLKSNQSLNAFIWMPEMGHGSSPIEQAQVSNTHFSFSEIAFIMPGLWVLHVEIIENNKVVDKWQKSIVL